MKIGISMEFDAAHHLPMHEGRCSRIHGHTYRVEVVLHGDPGDDGMIIDFYVLKKIVGRVIGDLDHNDLNSVLQNPTAEMIASHIHRRLREELGVEGVSGKASLISVRLWEGRDKWVMVDE
ncbi:MAG: 6-carboxytetrahydropterin synthase QueD [Methanothrix sp.]|uniref:6-carboxytetrahydropterin synthase QueD n=1 Tax=Methanothrix sp. TaxID=90426 RepID=UPI0025DF7B2A|nr:6-carboxytetrahydropterin synthase QueD [Methanothrix sp.]MCQ8903534.1 6-carboxytetrahydropterin synthase QueD [Methanothrix sp.]